MLSAKYEKMFTDFAQVDENEKLRKAGREEECQPILRTDIEAIHFYSTGAPWTLDVAIDEIGMKRRIRRKERRRARSTGKHTVLVDIEATRAGKGAGYARWATLFNLKQMAQTVAYLQDHELLDYAILSEKAAAASAHFNELSARIKSAETRMAEIAVLRCRGLCQDRDTVAVSTNRMLMKPEILAPD